MSSTCIIDSKSQYVYPFLGKAVIGRASYLDNLFGKNKKLIGFEIGAAPRAQIQGLFVFTKGVIEIISILVEIARRLGAHILYWDSESITGNEK